MLRIVSFSALAILAGALLGSCSNPQATATSAGSSTPEAPVASAVRISRADSLNGIPGHRFGEPLSAFPGLVLAKTQQPGTQTYSYPDDKPEAGWFGKHKKDVFSFYIFKDGKFQAFQAVAFGAGRAALQEEAVFLLGRGKQNVGNTSWDGQKATAFYQQQVLPKGPAEILAIQSQDLAAAQASESSERLKKENAM